MYLSRHMDQNLKRPLSDFSRFQVERNKNHQESILEELKSKPLSYTTTAEGADKTISEMKKGAELISQGVIKHDEYLAHPDILRRVGSKSALGDHSYEAIEIKLGNRLKDEYLMQVMFYSFVLSKIQGKWPKKAHIITGDSREITIDTSEYRERFMKILQLLEKYLEEKRLDVPIINAHCTECGWGDLCFQHAIEAEDLSLIFGMDKRSREKLNHVGITKMGELAKADPLKVSAKTDLPKNRLSKWSLQARSLLENRIIPIKKPSMPNGKASIFFDIEGDTMGKTEYLLGLLVQKGNRREYKRFWADNPKNEGEMWKDFLSFLAKQEDFRLYHYTGYEKRALAKLFAKYGGDKKTYDRVVESLFDLYPVLLKSVVLPVTSYSIKSVAPLLGFRWTNDKAGGAQSLLWYHNYQETKNPALKETILEYNRNDCEAMVTIRDWLLKL